jgi:transcriptional regulator with XRE-family HTH domain
MLLNRWDQQLVTPVERPGGAAPGGPAGRRTARRAKIGEVRLEPEGIVAAMARTARKTRNVTVVDNRPLARKIGGRIRQARLRAGLTQAELAKGRYTAAYISALELGHAKPSMAALAFIAERMGVAVREFVGDDDLGSKRLDADLLLASEDYEGALDRYRSLLEHATDRRRRAEVLRGMAEALCRLDRGGEAIRFAAEASELFQIMHRPVDAADAGYWLAYGHFQQDNTTEARALLAGLLAAARSGTAPVPDFQFRVLMAIAGVEMRDAEYHRAIDYMEEARGLSDALDLRRRANLLSGLAMSYREAGDLEAAVTTGMQSLALYRAAQMERDEAGLAGSLALTYMQVGNLSRAEELLSSAVATLERLGDPRQLAHIVESQAQVALARHDLDAAEALLARTLSLAEETGNFHAMASARRTASRIALERGDADAAATQLEAALTVLREHGPKARLQETLAQLADLRRTQGDLAGATDLYAEALKIHH